MKSAILAAVAAISLLCSLPASAAIVHYTITFNDPDATGPKTGGSGILTLNELVPGNLNENAPTLGESFVGTVNGLSFNINSSNFFQWHINLGGGTFYNLGLSYRCRTCSTSTSTEVDITTFNKHGSLLLFRMRPTQLGPARK
jgi:hypothetical protein